MTQTTPRPTTTDETQLDRNARRDHLRSKDWTPRPTLHGADYTSEHVYAEERERVWFDGWVCIGRDEEFPKPGDFLVRDIAGESVIVTRNPAGEPRAFYNVCAHRGTKLLDETGELCGHVGKAFKCPYHAWSFDLDGRLIGTPNVHEDESFEREAYPLHQVAVGSYAGFVFVNLSDAPEPLVPSLREGTESITVFDRYPSTSFGSASGCATRSRPTGRSSWRTTTSASTARRSIPSSSPSCRCTASARSGTRRRRTTATG
jgi:phenylpropionate dioxygenase-like ring-hydroxylating dioxygenase large terminal subunit